MNKKEMNQFIKKPRFRCFCVDCRKPRIKINGNYPKTNVETEIKPGQIFCSTFVKAKDALDFCSFGRPRLI